MAKVVMVNTVLSGSHGQIMRDLRDAATVQGMDVTLAYGRGAESSAGEMRLDAKAEVLSHVGITRLFDRHAQGSKAATKRFVRQLYEIQPDLLHMHNVHGYYLHAQTFFGYVRSESIPIIWTHHDAWAMTGHCSHFLQANCMRWQDGCYGCPLKRAYPASYGLDASRKNWQWKKKTFASLPSAHMVVPSRWLDGVMADSYLGGLPRQVIGSGVDLALFSPGEGEDVHTLYGIAPHLKILLAVAAPFDERKGFSDVLRIAEITRDWARVIMVGLTRKQMKALPQGVVGIERTDGPQALVRLYQSADCLINTTYEDTYPTVNMEAMACGTPVASYAVGGAAEQMAGPGTMAVVPGDMEAMAEAARTLAHGKPALTGVCRDGAKEHFDRGKAISAYMELYHTMLGG